MHDNFLPVITGAAFAAGSVAPTPDGASWEALIYGVIVAALTAVLNWFAKRRQ